MAGESDSRMLRHLDAKLDRVIGDTGEVKTRLSSMSLLAKSRSRPDRRAGGRDRPAPRRP